MAHFVRYYRNIFLIFISTLISACSPDNSLTALYNLPQSTQQVILVTSESWAAAKGTLQRFEKEQNHWKTVGDTIPVMLGRNGTSWGQGLHSTKDLTHFKQEGDGKAPAGIFKLGSSFGYASTTSKKQSYPYRQTSDRDYYVDDVESADYNQWVQISVDKANTPKIHWSSFEKMHRDDALYEWGLEVEHNKNPVKAKAGSAIFMHVWKNAKTPTSGCTSMPKAELITILEWIDAYKNPLLIQVPLTELENINTSKKTK